MISIYDIKGSLRSARLRDIFTRSCIPCAIASTESVSSSVNVFFNDTVPHFETIISSLDAESILICDAGAVDEYTECGRIVLRAYDILDVKYGINPESYFKGTYSDVNGRQRFYGRPVHLTERERLILKHISMRDGEWCTSAEIGEFCFGGDKGRGVCATHVNNINAKTLESTGRRIILTSRKFGYRFYKK